MDDTRSGEAARDVGTRLLPPLPGTRRGWVEALGQLSGLFLSLRDAEVTDGARLPEPFADGCAMRSWGRVSRPATAALASEQLDGVRVPVGDLDVLGDAAAVLGLALLREQLDSGACDLTAVLRREARVHGRGPERLVTQLARVHGVLSAAGPESALAVWRAGQ